MKIYLIVALLVLLSACASQTALTTNTDFTTLEPQASGKTYYVSGTGDDGKTGLSVVQAFRTIQKAANLTNPGDTVLVMNGLYTNDAYASDVVSITRSGDANNWIRFRAYPGHSPKLKTTQNWGGFSVNGAAYIIIDGFTLEGHAPSISLAYAQQEQNNLQNPVTSGSGISVSDFNDQKRPSHHVIIRNNKVYDFPGGGIETSRADYIRIEDNVVYRNAFYAPYDNSGISVYQSRDIDTVTSVKVIVRRNVVYKNENKIPAYFSDENNPGNRSITDGNGIIIDDGRNTQTFVSESAPPYKGKTLVDNNVAFDNGARGVNVFSSDNVIVRHNTLYHNGRTPTTGTDLATNSTSNLDIYGNIIVTRADRVATLIYEASAIRYRNNLYFGGNTPPVLTATDRVADPKFIAPSTNPALANFRLQASSPAIDKVTGVSPTLDVEKSPRPKGAALDIGAYESY